MTKIVKFGKLPGFWNEKRENDECGNEEFHITTGLPIIQKYCLFLLVQNQSDAHEQKILFPSVVYYGFPGCECPGFYQNAYRP